MKGSGSYNSQVGVFIDLTRRFIDSNSKSIFYTSDNKTTSISFEKFVKRIKNELGSYQVNSQPHNVITLSECQITREPKNKHSSHDKSLLDLNDLLKFLDKNLTKPITKEPRTIPEKPTKNITPHKEEIETITQKTTEPKTPNILKTVAIETPKSLPRPVNDHFKIEHGNERYKNILKVRQSINPKYDSFLREASYITGIGKDPKILLGMFNLTLMDSENEKNAVKFQVTVHDSSNDLKMLKEFTLDENLSCEERCDKISNYIKSLKNAEAFKSLLDRYSDHNFSGSSQYKLHFLKIELDLIEEQIRYFNNFAENHKTPEFSSGARMPRVYRDVVGEKTAIKDMKRYVRPQFSDKELLKFDDIISNFQELASQDVESLNLVERNQIIKETDKLTNAERKPIIGGFRSSILKKEVFKEILQNAGVSSLTYDQCAKLTLFEGILLDKDGDTPSRSKPRIIFDTGEGKTLLIKILKAHIEATQNPNNIRSGVKIENITKIEDINLANQEVLQDLRLICDEKEKRDGIEKCKSDRLLSNRLIIIDEEFFMSDKVDLSQFVDHGAKVIISGASANHEMLQDRARNVRDKGISKEEKFHNALRQVENSKREAEQYTKFMQDLHMVGNINKDSSISFTKDAFVSLVKKFKLSANLSDDDVVEALSDENLNNLQEVPRFIFTQGTQDQKQDKVKNYHNVANTIREARKLFSEKRKEFLSREKELEKAKTEIENSQDYKAYQAKLRTMANEAAEIENRRFLTLERIAQSDIIYTEKRNDEEWLQFVIDNHNDGNVGDKKSQHMFPCQILVSDIDWWKLKNDLKNEPKLHDWIDILKNIGIAEKDFATVTDKLNSCEGESQIDDWIEILQFASSKSPKSQLKKILEETDADLVIINFVNRWDQAKDRENRCIIAKKEGDQIYFIENVKTDSEELEESVRGSRNAIMIYDSTFAIGGDYKSLSVLDNQDNQITYIDKKEHFNIDWIKQCFGRDRSNRSNPNRRIIISKDIFDEITNEIQGAGGGIEGNDLQYNLAKYAYISCKIQDKVEKRKYLQDKNLRKNGVNIELPEITETCKDYNSEFIFNGDFVSNAFQKYGIKPLALNFEFEVEEFHPPPIDIELPVSVVSTDDSEKDNNVITPTPLKYKIVKSPLKTLREPDIRFSSSDIETKLSTTVFATKAKQTDREKYDSPFPSSNLKDRKAYKHPSISHKSSQVKISPMRKSGTTSNVIAPSSSKTNIREISADPFYEPVDNVTFDSSVSSFNLEEEFSTALVPVNKTTRHTKSYYSNLLDSEIEEWLRDLMRGDSEHSVESPGESSGENSIIIYESESNYSSTKAGNIKKIFNKIREIVSEYLEERDYLSEESDEVIKAIKLIEKGKEVTNLKLVQKIIEDDPLGKILEIIIEKITNNEAIDSKATIFLLETLLNLEKSTKEEAIPPPSHTTVRDYKGEHVISMTDVFREISSRKITEDHDSVEPENSPLETTIDSSKVSRKSTIDVTYDRKNDSYESSTFSKSHKKSLEIPSTQYEETKDYFTTNKIYEHESQSYLNLHNEQITKKSEKLESQNSLNDTIILNHEILAKLIFNNSSAEENKIEIDYYLVKKGIVEKGQGLEDISEKLREDIKEGILKQIQQDRIRACANTLKRLQNKILNPFLEIDRLTGADIYTALAAGNNYELEQWKENHPNQSVIDSFRGKLKHDSIEDKIRTTAINNLSKIFRARGNLFNPELLPHYDREKFHKHNDEEEESFQRRLALTETSMRLPIDFRRISHLIFDEKNLAEKIDNVKDYQKGNIKTIILSLTKVIERIYSPSFNIDLLTGADLAVTLATANENDFKQWKKDNPNKSLISALSGKLEKGSKEEKMRDRSINNLKSLVQSCGLFDDIINKYDFERKDESSEDLIKTTPASTFQNKKSSRLNLPATKLVRH